MSVVGYAVTATDDEHTILLETVHVNKLGAMVNWLIMFRKTLVTNSWTDETIERVFWQEIDKLQIKSKLVRVGVEPVGIIEKGN